MLWIYRMTVLALFTCLMACGGEKPLVFEEYNFQFKCDSWDMPPYKFSSTIENVVLKEEGSQLAATAYSNIGAYGKVLETWDSEANKRTSLSQEEIDAFNLYSSVNAHKLIIEKAQETSITIINEAHHISQHRVFTTSLLQDMWDNGYRHIGLEAYFTSSKGDSSLVANGYPFLTSGYYVKEPQMGNIIRKALMIGYDVFGYESNGHNGPKERDINQAKNIQDYISANPEGKVLIHCGYAHGSEGIYGGQWEKTMAARITEFMGVDPLTIDQTKYREMSDIKFENQYYQLAKITEPSIFLKGAEVFGEYKPGTWFDMYVFHPRTQNMNIPEWLLYENRKVIGVSFENEDINCPCLVLSYKEGEEIGRAIPYDVVETQSKSVDIVLGSGGYNVIVLNKDGKSLKTFIKN